MFIYGPAAVRESDQHDEDPELNKQHIWLHAKGP